MITAQEARNKTKETIAERTKREMKAIEEAVEAAIEVGEYYCYLYDFISDDTKNQLESLGYQFERMIDKEDGILGKIRWQ